MTLDEFISQSVDDPWRWGRRDCTLWVADWVEANWGFDPAEKVRGTYKDAKGAEKALGYGLLATASETLSRLRRRPSPELPGDVGVIRLKELDPPTEVAAIWTGEHWIFKTPPRGVIMVKDAQVLGCWGS